MNLPNHYIVYQIVDIVKKKDYKSIRYINKKLRTELEIEKYLKNYWIKG